MTIIYIPDPAWEPSDEQYYWSILNPDGMTRPAYDALKTTLPGLIPRPLAAPSRRRLNSRCPDDSVPDLQCVRSPISGKLTEH